jgi:hypothetical protein
MACSRQALTVSSGKNVKLKRFQAKARPALDAGWTPVRVKKTHQIKNLEPRFDQSKRKRLQAFE